VKTRLSDLQRELAIQTNIKRQNQMLHYNGRDVADVMTAGDVIFTHIKTTEDQPFVLLPSVQSSVERQSPNLQRSLRESFMLDSSRSYAHSLWFL